MFPVRWYRAFSYRSVHEHGEGPCSRIKAFRRRAGISASPVDLEDLIFFNSVLTNSSLIVDNLNVWRVLGESVVLRDGAENPPLIFWTADLSDFQNSEESRLFSLIKLE